MTSPPEIYILAGVNGSGKSSIGGASIRTKGNEYYNPDEAAQQLMVFHPNMSQTLANGHAWKLGKELLEEAIREKNIFAFETTLGGRTITDILLQAAADGAKLNVWYVGLESVDLNIRRVQSRVNRGGHPIPVEKIRERWNTSRRNLIRLIPHLHSLHLYDNSHEADPHKDQTPAPHLLLTINAGKITGPKNLKKVPDWAKPIIEAAIVTFQGRSI